MLRRMRRRRLLAVTGSAAFGAAFLAACGRDGDEERPVDAPGLVARIEDTSSNAQVGGVMPDARPAELQTLNPNQSTSGSALAMYGYSRLFTYRPGLAPELAIGAVDADAAQSWELSADGLQLTIKLRRDLKTDERAPTNGRLLTTEDVRFSWDAFAATNSSRGELVHAVSPTAAVDSLQVIDDETVSFKLANPVANTLILFAFQRYMWLLPSEADGGFDARSEMLGTGPWRLMRWEPSVGYVFERNPTWHIQGLPYLDGIDQRILDEYTQRRAQLVAGNLWTTVISPEDVTAVKNEQPLLNLYAAPFPQSRRQLIGFDYREGSPFHDARVRRAVSMLIDRDAWINAFYNVTNYAAEGLEVDARWDSHYMAGDAPYWIDPQGDGLGEGARYFQFNPAEAVKLMRAAGHEQPLAMPAYVRNILGGLQPSESLVEMINADGLFDLAMESGFSTSEWNERFHHAEGRHEGMVINQSTGQAGDIDAHISVRYNVGNGTRVMLPEVFPWYEHIQDLIVQQRRELDEERRAGLLTDLQKEMAVEMPTVPHPGAASGFVLAWPHLANFGLRNPLTPITAPTEVWTWYWYDASKAPT